MPYATYSDIESTIGWSFSVGQQTRCNALLTRMSSLIDGDLGGRWVTPFSSPYPGRVVECCALLTAHRMVVAEMIDQPQVTAVEERAKDFGAQGIEMLDAMRNDPSLLAGSSAVLRQDEETTIAPAMRVSTSPPSITFQDSSTWRRPAPSSGLAGQSYPKEYP